VIYSFTKVIFPDKFIAELLASGLPYLKFNSLGSALNVVMTTTLDEAQETTLNALVTAHNPSVPTATSVGIYLDSVIFPFVTNLIRNFAAENIAMGITQAGKTGAILGLFTKKYDVNSNSLPICLKDTFDTGSLYESIKVIQYLRDNPTEYNGLSPFITDARLHAMKNSIETCLGVTLT
jgi:hypothetical protein